MRSFAVIGFAAAVNAAVYGYPTLNTTSVSAPVYQAPTTVVGFTTTVPVKVSTTSVKASSAPVVPSAYSSKVPVVPYPSKNGTVPTYAVGTSVPTSTKPSPSQFTGAAAQTGAAMLAIVGAVAAFL